MQIASTSQIAIPGGRPRAALPAQTPGGLSAAGAELQELAAHALSYADAAQAPATRRAYSSAFGAFTAWCEAHGQSALPASAGAVALYLIAQARRLAVSSLMVHRAAIDAAHRGLDLPPPDSAHLRRIWAGVRRTHGKPPAKKRGLSSAELKRALKASSGDLRGRRDQALVLVGFASALRRSELAALQICKTGQVRLAFVAEGFEITLERGKGDQLGEGAIVAVPHGRHPASCPVRALRAWLEAADITSGPVFRRVSQTDIVGPKAIDARTVARVVKATAARAGLDPAAFAAHSLRRGMITEAVQSGADHDAVQAHARHSRWETTKGYVEAAERFGRKNPGRKIGL